MPRHLTFLTAAVVGLGALALTGCEHKKGSTPMVNSPTTHPGSAGQTGVTGQTGTPGNEYAGEEGDEEMMPSTQPATMPSH